MAFSTIASSRASPTTAALPLARPAPPWPSPTSPLALQVQHLQEIFAAERREVATRELPRRCGYAGCLYTVKRADEVACVRCGPADSAAAVCGFGGEFCLG